MNLFSKLKYFSKWTACFIFVTISLPSSAVDGLMLSYGKGMNDILIQYKDITGAEQKSVGLFWDSDYHFDHALLGYSELEFETYIGEIKGRQKMQLIAIRPILNFWDSPNKERDWYWQFGVGLSYFDSKRQDPVEFSSKGQFATVFGLGYRLDKQAKHRLTLRYNHYSNAYIERPNQGLDTFSLDWHFRF